MTSPHPWSHLLLFPCLIHLLQRIHKTRAGCGNLGCVRGFPTPTWNFPFLLSGSQSCPPCQSSWCPLTVHPHSPIILSSSLFDQASTVDHRPFLLGDSGRDRAKLKASLPIMGNQRGPAQVHWEQRKWTQRVEPEPLLAAHRFSCLPGHSGGAGGCE